MPSRFVRRRRLLESLSAIATNITTIATYSALAMQRPYR